MLQNPPNIYILSHDKNNIQTPQKMMKNNNKLVTSLVFLTFFLTFTKLSLGDNDNLYDTCPSDTTNQKFFINGFPCKNPSNITASDFKSSMLNKPGDTDNFLGSAMTIATASEFPGLNTLGLSAVRIDIEVDGMVSPHAHPRASEMIFVRFGVVVAGFVDSNNQVFQKRLEEGDVFVVPKGLLHFFFNGGFERVTIFSVLNSQNPGLASVSGAMFVKEMMMKKMKGYFGRDLDGISAVDLLGE